MTIITQGLLSACLVTQGYAETPAQTIFVPIARSGRGDQTATGGHGAGIVNGGSASGEQKSGGIG